MSTLAVDHPDLLLDDEPVGPRDIVVTWPKDRFFASYLVELERATHLGLQINFRVPSLPNPTPERCYRVHDGRVRGYTLVIDVRAIAAGKVERVASDRLAGRFWPAGNYIVCEPVWREIDVKPEMDGFRGWRWFDRTLTER